MAKEIELELTPVGGIRFKRGDKDHNDMVRSILSDVMGPDEIASLETFFMESEGIVVLEGDGTLCG